MRPKHLHTYSIDQENTTAMKKSSEQIALARNPEKNKCEKLVHDIHSEIIAYYRRIHL